MWVVSKASARVDDGDAIDENSDESKIRDE